MCIYSGCKCKSLRMSLISSFIMSAYTDTDTVRIRFELYDFLFHSIGYKNISHNLPYTL